MAQNTTKNILISVALIAFIVSSGAFTIYQLAKRQTNTTNDSQTSIQSSSSFETSIAGSIPNTSNLSSNIVTNELNIKFDPYVCGLSITGLVDKPEIIQTLEVVLTNKDKPETLQSFTPKIDEAKNFRLLVDDIIIIDGIYKLEAKASLNNQKSEITETTVEFKKDCANLIQNSTPASQVATISSVLESTISSRAEVKNENPVQENSTTKQSSQVTASSEAPRQIVEAPAVSEITPPATSSKSATENTNNPNSVRSGGLDITAIFVALMIILSAALIAKIKNRNLSINEVFGNK
jgi:hypothetical protein